MTIEERNSKIEELKNKIDSVENKEQLDEIRSQITELENAEVETEVETEERKLTDDIQSLEERSLKPNMVEIREERNMENKVELRNTKEYINAYAEYVKSGNDEEIRSLLSENATSGTIAVPDFVYDVVKTAWDKNEIMSLVKKAEIKGNLKVNFEIIGTEAKVHTEGAAAIDEETLTEGIATLVPEYIMKWISVSKEVLSMRGTEFLNYIYNELTYKITKKLADMLVAKIAALPQTATSTSVSAKKVTVAPAIATIATAIANLSDEATNPVVIMNKLTYANFKAIQYANNYGVDIFEGLRVLYNNSLPAYDSASTGNVYAIVGDLGEGALANFPNGNAVEFVFDPYTKKNAGLIEITGQEYVGLNLVADKAFTLLAKPATAV